MELVFVFAVVFLQILFVNLFEVVQVVGAFGIDTFVEDKVFAVLFGNQRMVAVGTAQLQGRKTAVLWGEPGTTYFAEYLSFGTIVFVEVWHRRITARTGAVFGDIAFRAAVYGLDLLSIAFLDIVDEFLVSPALTEVSDKWQFICLEFLVFGGMGVIMCPLPEGDISTDKVYQPAKGSRCPGMAV